MRTRPDTGKPADTAALRGRKRHAKTDRTDSGHLRQLLADGRLPECWIPPGRILECRALLELYRDLRVEHTAWVQRIHAVLFHQGAPALGEPGVQMRTLGRERFAGGEAHPGEALLQGQPAQPILEAFRRRLRQRS